MTDPTVVPSAPAAPVASAPVAPEVDTTPTLQPDGTTTVAGEQVSPLALSNEVTNPPATDDETDAPAADTPVFTLEETTPEGERTYAINVPTNYLELAALVEATITGFELANRNGVHNSVLDLNPGDTVVVPAPQLPVPSEAPLVDLDTATAQNIATQNAIGSIQAQATDAQAMIDPGFAAQAAGVPPISVDGGLAPSTAAVASPPVAPVAADVPAGDPNAVVEPTPAPVEVEDQPNPVVVPLQPVPVVTEDHPTPFVTDPTPVPAAPVEGTDGETFEAPAGETFSVATGADGNQTATIVPSAPAPTSAPVNLPSPFAPSPAPTDDSAGA